MQPSVKMYSVPSVASQKGVILIVALLILMAMTIISVSSMTNSNLEEKMAGNLKDREIAFQAAEAALRYGERLVEAGIDLSQFTTDCPNGLCDHNLQSATTTYPEYWTDPALNVWNDNTKHKIYNVDFVEVSQDAKLIIEHMGVQIQDFSTGPQASDPQIFRITSLGYGQSINSRVMLQSSYVKF